MTPRSPGRGTTTSTAAAITTTTRCRACRSRSSSPDCMVIIISARMKRSYRLPALREDHELSARRNGRGGERTTPAHEWLEAGEAAEEHRAIADGLSNGARNEN